MNRAELKRHLADYADGELAEEFRLEVEARLSEDPAGRAEVTHWQSLRRSAWRGLTAEPLPAGLRERLVERLAAERHRPYQVWRIVGRTMAAAAVVFLSVIFTLSRPGGPSGMAATRIAVGDLTHIYHGCACKHRHDSFKLAGMMPTQAVSVLSKQPGFDFAIYVPDLSSSGFRLAGACDCFRKMTGINGVHAWYERKQHEEGQPSRPEDVLSFFSIACPVKLCGCPKTCSGHCVPHQQRKYIVAHAADDTTILKWEEHACSFAVCSVLKPDELIRVVDAVDVAILVPPDMPALAHFLAFCSGRALYRPYPATSGTEPGRYGLR